MLQLYSEEEKDYLFVSGLIHTDTVAIHRHTSVIRHSLEAEKRNVNRDHVLYKLMENYCPLTEGRTLRRMGGKSYLDSSVPLTHLEDGRMPWERNSVHRK